MGSSRILLVAITCIIMDVMQYPPGNQRVFSVQVSVNKSNKCSRYIKLVNLSQQNNFWQSAEIKEPVMASDKTATATIT